MINITVADAFDLLAAIVRQALRDVRNGTEYERADACAFLDWICPHWQSWPAIHQQLAATIAAQRLAGSQPSRKRTEPAKIQRQRGTA